MRGDTIAAAATAMSNSGIGIIRISGEESLAVLIVYTVRKEKQKYYRKCPVIPYIMDISVMGKR